MENGREKLIQLLDEAHDEYYKICDFSRGYMDALADHLLANGVTFATDANKWINVDESLPRKITNKVLVCCKNGYIGFGHYEKFCGVTDWYNLESGKAFRDWDLEDCETYEVTHWMPLPKPPHDTTKQAADL